MPLFLTDHDVTQLVDMSAAPESVETALRDLAGDLGLNRPRQRIRMPRGVLHTMPGGVPSLNAVGLKTYASFGTGAGQLVLLFNGEDGRLEALLQSSRLGTLRTGAASGVATKYMARPDASVLGQIGVGRQGETQLEAVCAVRPITRVLVFSRTAERREAFAREWSERLGIPVEPADSAEEVARQADVLTTITTSKDPVVNGSWLRPGTHVNAAGSNWANRRELDEEVVRRADVIAADAVDEAQIESGDLVIAAEMGAFSWDRVVEVAAVVAGQHPGRSSPDQITLFESQGLAVEDVALAAEVYRRAREAGVGQDISFPG